MSNGNKKITIIFPEKGKIYIPEWDDGVHCPFIFYTRPIDARRLVHIASSEYEVVTTDPEKLREALRLALQTVKEDEEKQRREEEREKWLNGNYKPIFRALDELQPIIVYKATLSETQLRQRFERPIREGNKIRYRSNGEVQKRIEKEVQRWKRIQESKLAKIELPKVEEIVVETELARVRFVPVSIKEIRFGLSGRDSEEKGGSFAGFWEAVAEVRWEAVIEWWKDDEKNLLRQFKENCHYYGIKVR